MLFIFCFICHYVCKYINIEYIFIFIIQLFVFSSLLFSFNLFILPTRNYINIYKDQNTKG